MKSYGVTVQIKPLQQYFHMVLFNNNNNNNNNNNTYITLIRKRSKRFTTIVLQYDLEI